MFKADGQNKSPFYEIASLTLSRSSPNIQKHVSCGFSVSPVKPVLHNVQSMWSSTKLALSP